MKRTVTLLLSFVLVLSSFAALNPSRLSIKSYGNGTISVEVDGNRWEHLPGSLVLDDLTSGYHNVKVYEVRQERRGFRKVDLYKLLYASTLMLKPMHHMNIAISPSGKIRVSEEMMSRNGRGNRRNRDRDDREDRDDWGREHGGRDNDWNDNRDYNSHDYNQPMSDRMFSAASESIRKEAFDKDRLAMAKQIINNNLLYSNQVKEIMQVFSFDDYKLDFAKYAYGKTIDRHNYFMVFDSFSFRKNREELMDYIQRYR